MTLQAIFLLPTSENCQKPSGPRCRGGPTLGTHIIHYCRSHALTIAPGHPDAQNGDDPDTIARRKSSVIPFSVMPLRENEKKGIPCNPCLNPSTRGR